MKDFSELLKKYRIPLICVSAVIVIFAAVAIAVSCGGNKEISDWGKNEITAGIPEFSADEKEFSVGNGHIAAYYKNVSSTQIAEYESLLAEQCGIVMPPHTYPCAAEFEGRIITLHYNVTEMNFSVTVTMREADTGSAPEEDN